MATPHVLIEKWFSGDQPLTDSHLIRRKVFIEEQQITEQEEIDGTDLHAIHLVLYHQNKPIATGRLLMKDTVIFLGRIAVLPEWRGHQIGKRLVQLLINKAEALGYEQQFLNAQQQVQHFYEQLGFTICGQPFIEANIIHHPMKRISS
jgi:predicted GNAT family N-acyltransferase